MDTNDTRKNLSRRNHSTCRNQTCEFCHSIVRRSRTYTLRRSRLLLSFFLSFVLPFFFLLSLRFAHAHSKCNSLPDYTSNDVYTMLIRWSRCPCGVDSPIVSSTSPWEFMWRHHQWIYADSVNRLCDNYVAPVQLTVSALCSRRLQVRVEQKAAGLSRSKDCKANVRTFVLSFTKRRVCDFAISAD